MKIGTYVTTWTTLSLFRPISYFQRERKKTYKMTTDSKGYGVTLKNYECRASCYIRYNKTVLSRPNEFSFVCFMWYCAWVGRGNRINLKNKIFNQETFVYHGTFVHAESTVYKRSRKERALACQIDHIRQVDHILSNPTWYGSLSYEHDDIHILSYQLYIHSHIPDNIIVTTHTTSETFINPFCNLCSNVYNYI